MRFILSCSDLDKVIDQGNLGFRAIALVTAIDHITIINWVKQSGELLSDELPDNQEILKVTEIDELQTLIDDKKYKVWF
ncbi:hypothetical protein [Geminocystis sp. GBBB08]|uniref:hypothetical protein n=1 Tax=Geminocystis sp. GBBB08 TaxID=2604140 RepID=UPI0027E29555|nr:hypothetical protein [Geminocystis sp. GBBB08]MBL1208425.1 hypothetical protein [Geminocystis sp. GBBB08]